MQFLKIDSSYYNEHTKELELYVGNALHCCIYYENIPNDEEIEDIISDIEWEYNHFVDN